MTKPHLELIESFIVLVTVASGTALHYQNPEAIPNAIEEISGHTQSENQMITTSTPLAASIEPQAPDTKSVATPAPLRGSSVTRGHTLTIDDILTATNQHRVDHNLPPLTNNNSLNQAAINKVDDMFAQQYFEHDSPDGRSVSHLVEAVDYKYLRVGENLALGNYEDASDLVQAWMDSPGHRANILEDDFSEIGIGAAPGIFEGQPTWLAVQTFALPASVCPTPNESLNNSVESEGVSLAALKAELDQQNKELNQLVSQLENKSQEIDQLISESNAKQSAGNEAVKQGNLVAQESGSTAAQPHWDKGKQLQSESEALFNQATAKQQAFDNLHASFSAKQNTYNQQAKEYNQRNQNTGQSIDQLNDQIRKFNACLASVNEN